MSREHDIKVLVRARQGELEYELETLAKKEEAESADRIEWIRAKLAALESLLATGWDHLDPPKWDALDEWQSTGR